jgi:hypothetical protein
MQYPMGNMVLVTFTDFSHASSSLALDSSFAEHFLPSQATFAPAGGEVA